MSETNHYANVWKRATALSVDTIIIMFINSALFLLVTRPSELDPLELLIETNNPVNLWTYISQAIYYGYFLSSFAQATPGKKMFSIYVTNQDGSKLSFIQGVLRGTIGYFISNLLTMGIGFLIALGRPNKTALHDIIFHTYVLEGEPQDKFANALKSNSKYKEIYEKPVAEVKPKTTDKINLEMLVAEEEAKLKAAQVKEKIQPKESAQPSDTPLIEQKPIESVPTKPKKKPDDSW